MKNKHGNTGNRNASKSEAKKATSHIHARCTAADKEAWNVAAKRQGMTLTELIIKTLNKEIEK